MAPEKQTTTSSQQAKSGPEETEMNKLDLDAKRRTQEDLIRTQQAGLRLSGDLLEGGEDLPGVFKTLPFGISPEITSDIVQESLRDIAPMFQASGILDSGTAASVAGRTAGDIRRGSAEYNISNLLNLLNLATGSTAQIQSPVLNQSANLGSRLGGLRSVTGTQTTTSMNPFVKSFQTGLGSTLSSFGYSKEGGMSFGIN